MSGHERERLSAYLDRQLPVAERAAVEAHLAGCPECAAFLAELAEVDEAAAALPAEAPEGYFETFPARVRSRLEAPKAGGGRRVPVWTWAAAAALVLAVVTPLTLRQRRAAPGETLPAPPVALQPAPSMAEPALADEARRPQTPSPALPARAAPAPPGRSKSVPAAGPAPVAADAPAVVPPASEVVPRASKDEARAEGRFAREPGAPPPAPAQVATAQVALAEAESAAAAGGPAPEPVANREKGVRERLRPAAAEATAESVSPALSAATAGPAVGAPDVREDEDAFRRLEAARPRSAVERRRLRDDWNAFAEAHPTSLRADEARVRAIVAAREAWLAGGNESDEDAFRRDAAAYLQRQDARQKPRVERLLAEP